MAMVRRCQAMKSDAKGSFFATVLEGTCPPHTPRHAFCMCSGPPGACRAIGHQCCSQFSIVLLYLTTLAPSGTQRHLCMPVKHPVKDAHGSATHMYMLGRITLPLGRHHLTSTAQYHWLLCSLSRNADTAIYPAIPHA
jgi:hypothetical protein